jgi:hypothetical protein
VCLHSSTRTHSSKLNIELDCITPQYRKSGKDHQQH